MEWKVGVGVGDGVNNEDINLIWSALSIMFICIVSSRPIYIYFMIYIQSIHYKLHWMMCVVISMGCGVMGDGVC